MDDEENKCVCEVGEIALTTKVKHVWDLKTACRFMTCKTTFTFVLE